MNYINRVEYKRVKSVLSSERFAHTLRVLNLAIDLGTFYKINLEDIFLSAIYHDYTKEWSNEALLAYMDAQGLLIDPVCIKAPHLLHGFVAANLCQSNGWINNNSVYDSIAYHTVGYENFDNLGKIIYISDALEPKRVYSGIDELRKVAYQDLDLAVTLVAKKTIDYLKQKDFLIHDYTYKMISSLEK